MEKNSPVKQVFQISSECDKENPAGSCSGEEINTAKDPAPRSSHLSQVTSRNEPGGTSEQQT